MWEIKLVISKCSLPTFILDNWIKQWKHNYKKRYREITTDHKLFLDFALNYFKAYITATSFDDIIISTNAHIVIYHVCQPRQV